MAKELRILSRPSALHLLFSVLGCTRVQAKSTGSLHVPGTLYRYGHTRIRGSGIPDTTFLNNPFACRFGENFEQLSPVLCCHRYFAATGTQAWIRAKKKFVQRKLLVRSTVVFGNLPRAVHFSRYFEVHTELFREFSKLKFRIGVSDLDLRLANFDL